MFYNSGWHRPMLGGFEIIGGIIMIVWWVVIIWLAIMIVRWLVQKSKDGNKDNEKKPLDILKERYAKGEITQEEYERIKKDLET